MKKIQSDDLDAFREFSASTRESAVAFALAVRVRKSLTKTSGGGFWQSSTQAKDPTRRTAMI
ncbi:hypothetical protein [Yoonia sp.]|uniref:hypothetical protein n=1 Tax=Yoonia sp. TaxID=2212373 RepID=UPI002E018C03|nr:hypothetical protein [Yoonia sp.]